MDNLRSHYRALVGLKENWVVDDIDLIVTEKRIVRSLGFVGTTVVCPDCPECCSIKDRAPQRRWRHLDTMLFVTLLEARVPRSRCDTCGVNAAAIPWAGSHSRFTLLFEAFAIDVLAAASIWSTVVPPS